METCAVPGRIQPGYRIHHLPWTESTTKRQFKKKVHVNLINILHYSRSFGGLVWHLPRLLARRFGKRGPRNLDCQTEPSLASLITSGPHNRLWNRQVETVHAGVVSYGQAAPAK